MPALGKKLELIYWLRGEGQTFQIRQPGRTDQMQMTEKMQRNKKRIWIAWERQRRSIELARTVGAKLYIFDVEGRSRYPVCIAKTLYTLFKEKPHFLFVQNPSMILAAMACIYGLISDTRVVVDRHTNFRLNKPHTGSPRIWLFMRLHYFTLRYANITIVTNNFLAGLVKKAKGRPVVLPDKLPILSPTEAYELKGKFNILLISSFGLDEPVLAVLEAMQQIDKEICLYVTGNYKKFDPNLKNKIPLNVHLTGFISEQAFVNMLFSVDAVMVLTTSDYCMLCGCYESVAAEKPLITSDKSVLKTYFSEALFADNSAEDIRRKIQKTANDVNKYTKNTIQMKREIERNWGKMYQSFEASLRDIGS
ncbi:hypothetical protein HNR65_003356 [Desulfosalsimonas propionicica]|uniref:Glycosyltransferase n=1 Tax=Desulfosalsimonas propionicica TaxID=332175 RepID=A0A7W0CC78_9BACT|nr:glycosyltransferase [Desulfosalsimonas propionicica]MBA2882999.1 hypothetical protein [Desulfosalsimonas propionicica]